MDSLATTPTPDGTTQNPVPRARFFQDLMASIVVFLVALPLCLGIAIASGAPPAAGLVTGIIGGLIVGFISGSSLQVSGPAAGLTVIVYELVQTHGLQVLGMVVLLAGIVQLLAGLFKLGQWFRAVSPAVVQGMLAGIGLLIFASQFHVVVDDAPRGTGPNELLGGIHLSGGLNNVLSIPEAIWKGVIPLDESPHHWAARVGIITLLALLAWKALAPKRMRFLPAPLMGVLVGTSFAWAFGLSRISYVPVPDSLAGALRFTPPEMFKLLFSPEILVAGIGMAVVASAETLLCATAVDKMHQGPRTRYDRELAAQGVGNVLCGFVGGLPMTGVIVRSATNVEAGARTRVSAILHGLWLLVLVALLPEALRLIPTASLAAILVYTGYKLMDPQAVRQLWRYGKSEVVVYAGTVFAIVATDLLTGVLTGMALSAMKLLYNFSRFEATLETAPDTARTMLYMRGSATFIGLPKLAAVLEQVRPNTELHAHLDELAYIDHACIDLLTTWEKQHAATGGRLVLDWHTLSGKFNGTG